VGLFDTLLGRGKRPKAPAPDRLFAITTAAITLETSLGIRTRGAAGIVFQPLGTGDFGQVVTEIEELVRATGAETGTTVESREDEFHYRWAILRDPEVEDLAVAANTVGEGLVGGGYGDRLLAAVFAFEEQASTPGDRPEAHRPGRPLYFIYNYKRGSWYPFVPAGGEQQRDTQRELQLKAQLGGELPIEPELERWFPLWGIPV
jgi:hypothetical protein